MKDEGSPDLENPPPQARGTRGAEQRRQPQRKALAMTKRPVLKPKMKSGLQKPSSSRVVVRGSENGGVVTKGVPVRGNAARRGPFRPLNGLASRTQENKPSKVRGWNHEPPYSGHPSSHRTPK